jgi:hypothetical protein
MRRIFTFVASLFLCLSATAVTLQQLSMDQMTQAATSIVRARVTGSSTSLSGSTIYTHYQLQVSETWKGSAAREIMLPGGVAEGIRQSFPGVPQLQVGSEYVLFLWTSRKTGITHAVGMSQGIFSVSSRADGSARLSRAKIGEGMLDQAGRSVQDHAIQMDLSDMKARVHLTAGSGGGQ